MHLLDSYGTWHLTTSLTVAGLDYYVLNRERRVDAPSRVAGASANLRYRLTPRLALNGRSEYMSDRGGLFSGQTQALTETTATADYQPASGFHLRAEWHRDFSNRPFFLTEAAGKKERGLP